MDVKSSAIIGGAVLGVYVFVKYFWRRGVGTVTYSDPTGGTKEVQAAILNDTTAKNAKNLLDNFVFSMNQQISQANRP